MECDTLIEIKQFEYHVVDACNLACEFCSHYSNFKGKANILDPLRIESEWKQWTSRIRPKRVHLIGGEPLLNPNISSIVALAFRCWPDSTICVYSNGLLLKNHPSLRGSLKGGRFVLGLHYCDEEDKATERFVRKFFLDAQVEVEVVDGAQGWLQFYQINSEGKPEPFNHGNRRSSWENCIAAQQRCFVMKNGKLWKCPQVAYSDRAGIANWFADYEACTPDDDIHEWKNREEESCCSNCPATAIAARHGRSFMRHRLPLASN